MHPGALGAHNLHLGAAGPRSQAWAERAGRETGATYGLHSLSQTSDINEHRAYQRAHQFAGAAGKGSGANYEVVTKGQSTSFVRTAPFANDSKEWRHSTKRLLPSGAHAFQRTGHSADALTRDEFQATMHATHKPVAPQDSPLLDAFREQVRRRGIRGIGSLFRKFCSLDVTGDRLLSFNEFARGLLDEGMSASVDECRQLFRVFDCDTTGNVDYYQLFIASCGELSSRRKQVVCNSFRVLDPADTGAVCLSELLGAFDARAHPAVRKGQMSAEVVQQDLHNMFDTGLRNRLVSLAEFQLYYMAISAAIEDDRHFESVAQDTWQLPGALCA